MDNEFYYATCVYAGIKNQIDFEIKHGTEDRTEQLQYAVERYCKEHIVSGSYLRGKLEEYRKVVKERKNNA